jgi:hypothetical protein
MPETRADRANRPELYTKRRRDPRPRLKSGGIKLGLAHGEPEAFPLLLTDAEREALGALSRRRKVSQSMAGPGSCWPARRMAGSRH